MPFVARKVSRAKWQPADGLEEGEIAADALSADLRTQRNTLSFWRCGDQDADLLEPLLALASGSERLDRIDLVWMPFDSLKDEGVATDDTEGDTPVRDLVSNHVDAVHLDLVRLSNVAQMVAKAVRETRCRRWSAAQVKQVLAVAVLEERLALTDLSEKFREKVELAVKKEKAKREAEKAKREAEKAKREAEEKAKREAEEKAKREAEEKAKREAEERDTREAEERDTRETDEAEEIANLEDKSGG